MIEIGGKPILWHIMKIYSAHGANDFIICCGYKGYVIKEYFANYFLHMSDVTFDMADNSMIVHQQKVEPWRVTLVDTGENTLTGGRLKRVAEYVGNETAFCFTYGDGVSDLNVRSAVEFHHRHGKLATVTAVRPPGRYGALVREGDAVTAFSEKPRGDGGLDQRRLLRAVAALHRPDRRRRLQLGKFADHPSRRHGRDDGVRASRLLAGDGHPARQDDVGRALGIRQGTMENLALNGAHSVSFWRGKRVLLTGHSGFKGSWLTLWLHRLGATVTGISMPPLTTPNLYTDAAVDALCQSHFCDIRDVSALAELVQAARPEIVFHLAAQPLVYAGYRAPLATFETNVMGTVHMLDALRALDSTRVAVMVTTDKVYRDDHPRAPHKEDDPLGGYDPYSASKAASEITIESYRSSFLATQGMGVASARAGNVIGGGDWSADRLIPDAVRAWQAGEDAGGAPAGGRASLAARAGSALRLSDAGASAVGAAGAGRRL